MSLQRNVSKSAGFLLFLARSGRKKLFKAKEKPCTSAGMQGTRWSKQRKVAITLPAILQEAPKRPSDALTANEALHLSELGCWGRSPQMGLGVKEKHTAPWVPARAGGDKRKWAERNHTTNLRMQALGKKKIKSKLHRSLSCWFKELNN